MNKTLLKWLPVYCIVASGCAVIQRAQPADGPHAPPPAPVVIAAAADTVTEAASPAQRVLALLSETDKLLKKNERSAALKNLAVVSDHLIATFNPEGATAERLERTDAIDLTFAAVDAYAEALEGIAPIPPSAPFAKLVAALPPDMRGTLGTNKGYRDLYIRILAGTSPVYIPLNDAVREKIAFFQKNDQRIFRSWMNKKGRYGPLIRKTLREEDIPEDLIYLSMIESGFNTKAYSRAKAVGMWQFVKHTARLYRLKTDTYIDERRDPEKSTRAAARHIRHLYNLFGDWQLVITSYNCGQGRLQRSMRKDGTHDFWKLDSLPRETRNHLPKFMAVLLMARDPEFFGVDNLQQMDPFAYDIIRVSDAVDLRLGAQCAGTTYETMRSLNSELRLGYTPPMTGQKTYALRVPIGTSDRFLDRYAKISANKKVQLVDYRVRSGDTVSGIAQSFGVRSSVVLDANGIRNPRLLRSGQKLKIPIHPKQNGVRLAQRNGGTIKAGEVERVVYRVKRGDTLWDIARNQGVTADQLRAWNTLKATGHIHPGDRLTIWRKSTTPSASKGSIASIDDTHRVKRGDTLWDIARAYKTSVRELKRINGIRDASQIKAGDRLRVRSTSEAVE